MWDNERLRQVKKEELLYIFVFIIILLYEFVEEDLAKSFVILKDIAKSLLFKLFKHHQSFLILGVGVAYCVFLELFLEFLTLVGARVLS